MKVLLMGWSESCAKISAEKKFRLTICPTDALKFAVFETPKVSAGCASSCAPRDKLNILGKVKSQYAERWNVKSTEANIPEQKTNTDWTFSTPYWGTLELVTPSENGIDETTTFLPEEFVEECPADTELPWDLLTDTSKPIHWFQSVDQFADELDDNGVSQLGVKFRVMGDFFFLLLRFELRVDEVVVRRFDTRFFHEFGSDKMLREFTTYEASIPDLKASGKIKVTKVTLKLPNIQNNFKSSKNKLNF